jgi:hypothetical protein
MQHFQGCIDNGVSFNAIAKFRFSAIDKDKFNELLVNIGYVNDRLHESLGDLLLEGLTQDVGAQLINLVSMAKTMDEIQTLVRAEPSWLRNDLPLIISAALKSIGSTAHVPKLGENGKWGNLDHELKDLLDKISNQASQAYLQYIHQEPIGEPKGLFEHGLPRTAVCYDNSWYYAEWKQYGWTNSLDERRSVQDSIYLLAKLLIASKQTSCRTLGCFIIHNEEMMDRFLVLYRWPDNAGRQVKPPKSLWQYVASSYKPSLSSRLRLASELAKSLLLLHFADWMHKAISSDNMIFFACNESGGRSLADPYLVGFDYSRTSVPNTPSQKLDGDAEIEYAAIQTA